MTPIRFDPTKDRATMPFDDHICRLARDLKKNGLVWAPHVGCFVWDPEAVIKTESPFPGRIYFVLSLPRFVDIFGSIQSMVDRLVWLPTWHQARLVCRQLGISDTAAADGWPPGGMLPPGEDLALLYRHIAAALRKKGG